MRPSTIICLFRITLTNFRWVGRGKKLLFFLSYECKLKATKGGIQNNARQQQRKVIWALTELLNNSVHGWVLTLRTSLYRSIGEWSKASQQALLLAWWVYISQLYPQISRRMLLPVLVDEGMQHVKAHILQLPSQLYTLPKCSLLDETRSARVACSARSKLDHASRTAAPQTTSTSNHTEIARVCSKKKIAIGPKIESVGLHKTKL